MWIHYRFRHAVQWEKGIPISGSSITVADLERAIIAAKFSSLEKEKKGRRRLAEVRLLVYNAETGEEYGGDDEEIPANTRVIVHLLTLWSKAFLESKCASQLKTQLRSSMTEEGCKQDTVVRAGRPLRLVWHYSKTPPGYICHRCHVPGHYIQACPTNGDPSYDIKGSKHPTGLSKAASEKNVVSSTVTLSARRFPKELNCPLCKEVMKEAVLMRCCFRSFCDKCIRDLIISRSVCACAATNISVDDLIPNKTLRETIGRLMSSTSSSSGNDRSCCLQAPGPETDHYSETAAPLPSTIKSAPTASSRESVAVSGVTDHYSETAAPLPSTKESAPTECPREAAAVCSVTDSTVRGASKPLDAPTTELITADRLALPSSLGTPNVEVWQKINDMGGRKRVSSNEDVSMIKEPKRRRDEDCRAERLAGLESTASVHGWSTGFAAKRAKSR